MINFSFSSLLLVVRLVSNNISIVAEIRNLLQRILFQRMFDRTNEKRKIQSRELETTPTFPFVSPRGRSTVRCKTEDRRLKTSESFENRIGKQGRAGRTGGAFRPAEESPTHWSSRHLRLGGCSSSARSLCRRPRPFLLPGFRVSNICEARGSARSFLEITRECG